MESMTWGESRLVRAVRFRAAHHYRVPEWSEDENARRFGDQARPHTHDWRVEVHVSGPVDPHTGWCVDLVALDAVIADVTRGWDGGDLNALVPDVARGAMRPSTENLARWLFQTLASRVPDPARLAEVRVFESDDLGSVFPA